jgi:anti-sigma B factor antagonist
LSVLRFSEVPGAIFVVSLRFTKHELQPGVTVLAFKGSVHCGQECSVLEAEVNSIIEEKQTRVIFDLSEVVTMDSAAIGTVVFCSKKLKNAGGDLRLASPPPLIARSLQQTKVNKIVPTFATVEEAAASFALPPNP